MTNQTINPLNLPRRTVAQLLEEQRREGLIPAGVTISAKPGAAPIAPVAKPAPRPAMGVEQRVVELPLAEVEIDPDQIRRYLPLDLRADLVAGKLKPGEVLAQLAKRNDEVSKRYLADIRSLADSIRQDTQLVSAIVTKAATRAQARWRLVDGERRYWALLLLEREDPLDRPRRLRAEMALETLDADQLKRMQFRANFDRRQLSTMDLVDLIAARKAYWDGRIAVNRADCERVIGASQSDVNLHGLPTLGVARDLKTLTGIQMHPNTVLRYVIASNNLTDETKTFARVHDLGFRALRQISTWAPDKQMAEMAKRYIATALDDEVKDVNAAQQKQPASGGRPSAAARVLRTNERLMSDYAKFDEPMMTKIRMEDLRDVARSVEEALNLLRERKAMCDRVLLARKR